MFNLLPEKNRELVRQEYKFRSWTVFLLMVCVSFIVLIVIFAPVLFVSNNIYFDLKKEIENLNKSTILVDYQEMSDELNKTNDKVSVAKKTLDTRVDLEELINDIEEIRLAYIKIYRFAFSNRGENITMIISGKANNRDALNNFSAKLKGLSNFGSVDVPLSSFTKATKADFSITLKVATK